jgi:dipeptidyl aminopeptidase/acylaminoacyl peptidase
VVNREIRPFGTWNSPLSAAYVTRSATRPAFPVVLGDQVWWQESRPDEGGRTTIMRRLDGEAAEELLPVSRSARTRVHECGGRSYLPLRDGPAGSAILFTEYADQRIYRLDLGTCDIIPLTPVPPQPTGYRYADMVLAPDAKNVWCVRESHDADPGDPAARPTVVRDIVAIPLDGGASSDPQLVRHLTGGSDFVACPRPSPGGNWLAWIRWDHPRMPWDGAELCAAPVEANGTIGAPHVLMGGPSESALGPAWRSESELYIASDRSGWWNLYRVDVTGGSPQPLYPRDEEFADWLDLGAQPFAVLGDGRLAVSHGRGVTKLAVLDPDRATLSEVDIPYADWPDGLSADGLIVAGVAGSPSTQPCVVRVDLQTGTAEPVSQGAGIMLCPDYLPSPRAEELTGPSGQPVHAWVYPPASPRFEAPPGELPPYIVFVHGGPTAHVSPVLDMEIAFFTTRGIGVIDVNYGGSTGYGRAYRERLRHAWGIVDVEDAVTAARVLADRGEADGRRMAIRGASAGGWTTLGAVTRSGTFQAGTSYFGICEPLRLLDETHDFESHYLYGLIGDLPAHRNRFTERAPLSHADEVHCPVLLLQGLDDPVVQPVQSELFAKAMARHGIRHAYLAFEGEGHGFRQAETKIACLEAELSFYGQVLGFEPVDIPKIALSPGDDMRKMTRATRTGGTTASPSGQPGSGTGDRK